MSTILILGLTFLIGSLIAVFGHYYFYQRNKGSHIEVRD